jgi:hypothetical protein
VDALVESLPAARILLLVNYRPEYQHTWGSDVLSAAANRPAARGQRPRAPSTASSVTTRRFSS